MIYRPRFSSVILLNSLKQLLQYRNKNWIHFLAFRDQSLSRSCTTLHC